MSKSKTFDNPVEEAKGFVKLGELKKAISTLNKAIDKNPELDVDEKVKIWISELEIELKEVKIENEINFQILKPIQIAGKLRKHPDIVKLPRSYKEMEGGFLIAVEDME